ncbi:MAG: response regulator, partial [Nannocystaceae bacterium]
QVLAANRAELGIDLAKEHGPDLVIMDISLPGMDGLTATRRLRGIPTTSKIPILALTASAMRGDERRVLAAGCDSYISKPFDIDVLLHEIEQLLAARKTSES